MVCAMRAQTALGHPLDRHQFDEVSGIQSATKSRRAGGRQHVIRADRVVAADLGRPFADKHRAGIHDRGGRSRRCRRPRVRSPTGWRVRSLRSSSPQTMIPPCRAIDCRGRAGRRASAVELRAATASASRRLVVINTARASGSCSACASRSAAIHAGWPDGGHDQDFSRAGVEVDAAVGRDPCDFAAETQRLPGPTILSTRGIVRVP